MSLTLKEIDYPGDSPPKTPENTVVYAIGDIHGCDDLLRVLHQAILEDANKRPASRQVVVYLGDYMSRGPSALKTMDRLIGNDLPGFEKVFLKGNHEDIITQFLAGELTWGGHWLTYGGINALASYGVEARPEDKFNNERLLKILKEFMSVLPQAHFDFLKNLSLSHREGEYIFVHAGITPGASLEESNPKDLMWIRNSFHLSDLDHGGVVVHGHTVTEQPVVRHNRIGIDTGAYKNGVLTCLVAEGNQRWFLQT